MGTTQPATSATGVRWQLTGTMVQACNCDWGCPCEFNSAPSHGHCHGTWSWHVKEGSFGSTSMDGIHFAAACKWPGAIHEGNGECLPILDSRATESQLQALGALLGGKAGGPWEIIASTLTKVHEPKIVDWEFVEKGAQSFLRAGELVELQLTPMTNPVSGDEFEASVKMPNGFISHELHHSSTRTFRVGAPIDYAYPGKDAAYGQFDYEGTATS